ncbi:MAG: ATP synthase subunit C [Thiobacillaceae bacterium]|nr:ATP synthase subunit C [Thiobacillaceae bacterium]
MGVLVLSVVGLVFTGVYWELTRTRRRTPPSWVRVGLLAQVALYALGMLGILYLGVDEALAQETMAGAAREVSLGMGLAIIGAGLPTAVAAIGAAIALGPIGSAALAVLAEKPEMFGRMLIYLGLAEGIAIYGLVVSILLLGKI